MTNTIELLESIGSDASLRHASAEDLERTLETMHASDALRRAVTTGEPQHLKIELGHKERPVNHNPPPPPPFNTQMPPPPPKPPKPPQPKQ